MRSNPLVAEVLTGLTRRGKAQLDYLWLMALQAAVLFVWWPKGSVAELLQSQHGPHTLEAVAMAVGVSIAYFALRAGAEESMLPGQHGLRDWALATPLGLARILRGYVLGQFVHSLHLLALSSPLLLMAFTVSGGEWGALGWCMAGALVQALFYRLCGAITHLTIGQHRAESYFTVRAILLVAYVPVGWFVPQVSHVALCSRALGESMAARAAVDPLPEVAFLAAYAGLTMLAAFALHRLLARERRGTAGPPNGAGVGAAAS